LSSAKKAVDSTVKRILLHMAEIVMSVILLVIICLPLVFVIPMWFQQIILGASPEALAVNPVAWFGAYGAFAVTVGLAVLSLIIGYGYIRSISPKPSSEEEVSEAEAVEEAVEAIEEEVEAEVDESASEETPEE